MDLPGSALQDLPTSQQLLGAIQSRQTINLGQFELTYVNISLGAGEILTF